MKAPKLVFSWMDKHEVRKHKSGPYFWKFTSYGLDMVENGSDEERGTPRKYSKRSSAEYMRAMSSPGGGLAQESSPETPSPPRNGRRSSTSLGFFVSPMHRAEGATSRTGHSGLHENAFLVPQSPSVKSRLLPPTTPKSRNAEVFLSPSPNLKSPGTYKDNGKPIREISNGLKARLNYALVKLQNGWVDKTMPELENELSVGGKRHKNEEDDEDSETSAAQVEYAREALLKGSSYNNEFMTDTEDVARGTGSSAVEEGDTVNSAHLAFLKALSSPKKKMKQEGGPRSPLQWSKPKKINTSLEKEKDQPSEVEAIETLMSLSSPQRPRSSNRDFSLPIPPKVQKFPGSAVSPSSSSSRSSIGSQQHPPLTIISGEPTRPITVPIMQKQSSESSPEPLEESYDQTKLHYDQQQTDVETDVESDND